MFFNPWPMYPPPAGPGGGMDLDTMRKMLEFFEEREKKAKEAGKSAEKKDEKKPFWGLSHREIFWYSMAISPFVGVPMAMAYISVCKAMWRMLEANLGLR